MKTIRTSTSERVGIMKQDSYRKPERKITMDDGLFHIPDPGTFGADGYASALGTAAHFLEVILTFCWSEILGYLSAKLVRRSRPHPKQRLKTCCETLNSMKSQ